MIHGTRKEYLKEN